jgi:hypothetical protein
MNREFWDHFASGFVLGNILFFLGSVLYYAATK